jgi:hypothetical protein
MPDSYTLDSNILIYIIRETPLADYVRQTHQPLLD